MVAERTELAKVRTEEYCGKKLLSGRRGEYVAQISKLPEDPR